MSIGKIAVLTGAGVSAESGISTFRDPGGLWSRYDLNEVATFQGFRKNPALVWKFYSERRRQVLQCNPNTAHIALAEAEDRLPGGAFTLITQNVDELHIRAGSRNVIEIHGSILRTKCSGSFCPEGTSKGFPDKSLYLGPEVELPRCRNCGELLRPAVVWFGETLNPDDESAARAAIVSCDLFLAIGTSGAVYPAASYAAIARQAGAKTVLINTEEPDNLFMFDEFIKGSAATESPKYLKDILESFQA